MKQRIITGLVMAVVLVPIIVIETLFPIFQVVMLLFVIVATHELINMYEQKKKMGLPARICIFILTAVSYFTFLGITREFNAPIEKSITIMQSQVFDIRIPAIASISLIVLFLFGLTVFSKMFDGEDIGKALTIIIYIGLGGTAITTLRFLGVKFIVYITLISTCTDIFAYFFGMKFGKHKMAPSISPKKSWEGAIAGTICATIIASCFALFYGTLFPSESFLGEIFNADGQATLFDRFSRIGEFPLYGQALIIVPITAISSVVAQIGDLVASRLKRTYDIKDFGNVFPGHGGVLDRFDSILFVSMFAMAVFTIIANWFPA